MSVIAFILTLVVLGVIMWLVNEYVPMDPKIKRVLNIVVLIAVVIWVLSVTGVLGYIGRITVPTVN